MQWLNRYSLSTKAMLTGIIVGLILWLSLDYFQKYQLDRLLNSEVLSLLEHDSQSAQSRFYKSIEEHDRIIKLFATQDSIARFLLTEEQDQTGLTGSPEWMPKVTSWRGLILPSAFILFNKNRQHFATYNLYPDEKLPLILSEDADSWLNESLKSPLLSRVDGEPTLIVSAEVSDNIGGTIGFVTMFVRIDDHFMYNKLAQHLSQSAIAVLFSKDTKKLTVLTSSDLVRTPKGMMAETLKKSYLFAGRSLFDQGEWQLHAKLFILLPQDAKATLALSIKQLDRQQRFYSALIFVTVFTVLMIIISRRIQTVSKDITAFANNELGIQLSQDIAGDAVANLKQCFEKLSMEIVDAQKKLLVQHEMERRVDQLQILETVTNSLHVGVLEWNDESWSIINTPMHQFVQQIGVVEFFTIEDGQHQFVDKQGAIRVIKISHLQADKRSLILVTEVTELALKTEELTKMALYDALTGLPNRVLFHDRLNQLIDSSSRDEKSFSVLLLDLDHFKEVNDSLGHSVGDKLLTEVAYRFNQYIRSADTFARIGGDEFAFLLPGVDTKKAESVATKLVEAQHQPYQIDTHQINIGSSVGIVSCPEAGETVDMIMSRVDMAMYHAKRNQLGFSNYKSEIDSSNKQRLRLIAELGVAIQQEQITVFYQPLFDMKTKEVASWEALARWKLNEHEWVSPDVFIPIAEETGLINDITDIVLNRAIKDCQKWQHEGQSGGVSVNLSTRDLIDGKLNQKVNLVLDKYQLASKQLTLEVTESILMQDPVKAKHELKLLDKLGVSLSVDDFGTGYSSLAYLKHLPVNEIKIDQEFVKNLLTDSNDEAIVRAVLSLAKSLNLKVVAEGVENRGVFDRLGDFDCDITQGFFISKPMPYDQVVIFNLDQIKVL